MQHIYGSECRTAFPLAIEILEYKIIRR